MTAAGWDSQVGYAPEGVFGVFTAPTRAIEHVKSGLRSRRTDSPSKGIKAGRRGAIRMFRGVEVVEGPISHELSAANIALLGSQFMGAVITTGAGPYSHALTDGPLVETRGISVQVGTPSFNGTVNPLNFSGCQIKSGTISVKGGSSDAAMIDLDWVGQHMQSTGDGDVVAALTPAVYSAAWAPFTGLDVVLLIDGVQYEFDDLTWKFDNGLRTGNYTGRSPNAGRAKPSKEQGHRVKTATVRSDFWDLAAMNRSIAGTEVPFSLAFTRGTSSLTIAGAVHSQVESPGVEGLSLVKDALNLQFISATSDPAACTITVVNGDATP